MKNIATIILILFSTLAYSQETPNQDRMHKNIYINLLGADQLIGIHYDMRVTKNKQDGLGFAVGIGGGGAIILTQLVTVRMIPLELNYVIGKGKNSLLLGTGFVHMNFNSENIFLPEQKVTESGMSGLMHIAYRHQPLRNGFFFQVGFEITSFGSNMPTPIPFSIAFGYGFK